MELPKKYLIDKFCLISGQVDMMFGGIGNVVPYVKAGKLNVLAVTGDTRWPALPEVATMPEAGLKDFESSAIWGISVPKGTAPEVVGKLNGEMQAVLRMPDIAEKMFAQGLELRTGTPEEYTALLRAQYEKYRILLPRISINPE